MLVKNTILQQCMKSRAALLAFAACFILSACNPSLSAQKNAAKEDQASEVKTKFAMSIFGAIHGTHRSSSKYSLTVLEQAVRNFNPDVVFIEIPPDSLEPAKSSFDEFGEVRERRTRAFPELTDVIFPLQKKLGFEMVATAGWSRQMANNRAAILENIENDPSRKNQWDEHIAAQRNLARVQRGKNDDPFFIHTDQYDAEVKAAQTPYEAYFDNDIGEGGWGPINDAHIGLMTSALDRLKADSKTDRPIRILVIFGAWHKYKILEAMKKRDDVTLVDARQFFVE